MKNKLFVIALSIILIVTMLPISVFAQTDTDNSTDYFNLKAYFEDMTISMKKVATKDYDEKIVLEYSYDKENWQTFDSTTDKIPLKKLDTVYFREKEGYPWPENQTSEGYWKFVMKGNGRVDAAGNLMSLLDNTCSSRTIGQTAAFYHLFDGCTQLMSTPNFPATTLSKYCYAYMFKNCTNLRSYNALKATTLKEACYKGMFQGCECLTLVSKLPAKNLAKSCYELMFRDCTTLVNPPNLPATTLANSCYKSMFRGCVVITDPPILPAKTQAQNCYSYMFYGCKKLQYVSVKFTSWKYSNATSYWLSNTNSKAAFFCPSGLSTKTRSTSRVHSGWTVNKPSIPKMNSLYAYAASQCVCHLEWKPLNFTDVEYWIYRGKKTTGDWGSPIAKVKGQEYLDRKVTTDIKYYYMIKPVVKMAGKTFHGEYSNKDFGRPHLNKITNLVAKATDSQTVSLTWDRGFEDQEYWIYRGTKPTGDWGGVYAKVTEYYFPKFFEKHPSVKPGVKYYYMVRSAYKSRDGKYHFGEYSDIDYAYPKVPTPTKFSAKALDKKTCQITWKKVSGSNVKYLLYRGTKPTGDWGSPIATLKQGTTKYLDKKVKTGKKYYYMMRTLQVIDGKKYYSAYTPMDYALPK